jgi:D-ribulokinase
MLAAVASNTYPDLQTAMPAMSAVAGRCEPATGAIGALHEARYQAFLMVQALARQVRNEMQPLLAAATA